MKQRVDRMSRLKEVAVGEHTEKDVETAVAKISEVYLYIYLVSHTLFFSSADGSMALRATSAKSFTWFL